MQLRRNNEKDFIRKFTLNYQEPSGSVRLSSGIKENGDGIQGK
jgi:hypothetical protein